MSRINPRAVLRTEVPGLDEVLGGGLREGGLYLVYGASGSGKTMLAAQIAFATARRGEHVLVVTLISESHGKLLDHLSGLDFFDESFVGSEIVFLNGYESAQKSGADGLLELLASLAGESRPKLLILEGFGTLRTLGLSDMQVAGFVHQLNSLVSTLGCLAIIVEPASPARTSSPEQALVDGILELGTYSREGRIVRELQVHKLRGSNPLLGRNVFRIDASGIAVYPRLEESVARRVNVAGETHEKGAFGIAQLDAMTEGGLTRGASTVLLGAPGAGKTLLGLKYLEEGVRQGETALYFGFYESPPRLLSKAERVGIQLRAAEAKGRIAFIWQPPLEYVLDELGYKLLAAVAARKPSRVLIDGVEGFQHSAIRKERVAIFLTALMVELRSANVDVLFTQELGVLQQTVGSQPYLTSALVENIVLLRYEEHDSRLRRLISILKMRESEYDTSTREFRISSAGLEVGESALAGAPAKSSST
jgi:circadian clock protein KaiC